ncbi:MAG: carboxylesterase family protein [Bryobacteraceae bacterium]|jgi:para-nitrobenzyl esterase
MMKHQGVILGFAMMLTASLMAADRVPTDAGMVEGTASADAKIRVFKGIPYAAPPVGALRWKAPQPVAKWADIRKTVEFAPRCTQGRIYDDMVFRDKGGSEDCLYLNVWAPVTSVEAHLPVMVWIHGGGFIAGASSEPRQDGENLARKGVVVVTLNYRLGVFGFLAHPELTRESDHNASGNYGLLDQVAALGWVHRNIALFGGDPGSITIFGESAGSLSVSALMATPLAEGLFQRAIGESGAFFGDTLSTRPLAVAEFEGVAFGKSLGAGSITRLRAKTEDEILQASLKPHAFRFSPDIDGYFLPSPVSSIFENGKQSSVPLLAGWNADEGGYQGIFEKDNPTPENFVKRVRALYGGKADAVLKLYPAATGDEAKRSAADLAGDRFIAFGTWKWIEMHAATGGSQVFRYEFDQAPPMPVGDKGESRGAYHSAEIEFVFGALPSKNLPWGPEDTKLSDLMSTYWSNFAKTGDPNGEGLPKWPAYNADSHFQVMHLSGNSAAAPDAHRARYEFLDSR